MASLVEETDAERRARQRQERLNAIVHQQQQHGERRQENQNIEMPRGLRRFDKNEIVQLTNNFNESRIIGEGSFGHVYRGINNNNPGEREYAIKVLSDELRHGSTQQRYPSYA